MADKPTFFPSGKTATGIYASLAEVAVSVPVKGEVESTSPFGVRTDPFLGRPAMHTGIDFRGATGDPIAAALDGKVISAGWAGGYGRMVEIDHGGGLATRYGHTSKINVKAGQIVKAGTQIAEIGSTGRSTGPHLHFEVLLNSEPIDPRSKQSADPRVAKLVEAMNAQNLAYGLENKKDNAYFKPSDPILGTQRVAATAQLDDNIKPADESLIAGKPVKQAAFIKKPF